MIDRLYCKYYEYKTDCCINPGGLKSIILKVYSLIMQILLNIVKKSEYYLQLKFGAGGI